MLFDINLVFFIRPEKCFGFQRKHCTAPMNMIMYIEMDVKPTGHSAPNKKAGASAIKRGALTSLCDIVKALRLG